jgi:hypothetical protein
VRTNHPHRRPMRGRARGLAVTGATLSALGTLAVHLAATATSAWASVRAPGPAQPDQAVAALCAVAALALSLWLTGAVVVSAAVALTH